MRSRHSRHVLLTLLVTFSFAAAACSSGGGSTNNAVRNLPDDVEIPDGFGDSPGSGSSGFFDSAECQQLAEAFDGLSSGSDTDDFEATADFLRDAADEAPDEVADDLRVMADTYDQILDDPSDVGAIILGGDFIEATTNLSIFIAETCAGLDLDDING